MSSQDDPRHQRLTATATTSPLYSSVSRGCAGVARKPIPEDTFPLTCIKEKIYLSTFKSWELACKNWPASSCRKIRGARPQDARSRPELPAGSPRPFLGSETAALAWPSTFPRDRTPSQHHELHSGSAPATILGALLQGGEHHVRSSPSLHERPGIPKLEHGERADPPRGER